MFSDPYISTELKRYAHIIITIHTYIGYQTRLLALYSNWDAEWLTRRCRSCRGSASRTLTRDMESGRMVLEQVNDNGVVRFEDIGLDVGKRSTETFSSERSLRTKLSFLSALALLER